jgi:hypothetical protein
MRNPDGLARALSRIGDSGIPEGGEGREYCFIQGPRDSIGRGFAARRHLTGSLHPAVNNRVQRLQAQGAVVGGGRRGSIIRLDTIRQHPGKTSLAVFLLILLVPLVVMVGYLTAIVMTMGLGGGLMIAAGVLG